MHGARLHDECLGSGTPVNKLIVDTPSKDFWTGVERENNSPADDVPAIVYHVAPVSPILREQFQWARSFM
jgi:hypothetical protein